MSFFRENVAWESADGSWNRAFFDFAFLPDWKDVEHDVAYDYDNFVWVATGLSSEDAAFDAWEGPNPGAMGYVSYEDDQETCEEWSGMAEKFLAKHPEWNWKLNQYDEDSWRDLNMPTA